MRNAEQHCGRHAQRFAAPGRARRVQANASAEQIAALIDGKYRFCDGEHILRTEFKTLKGMLNTCRSCWCVKLLTSSRRARGRDGSRGAAFFKRGIVVGGAPAVSWVDKQAPGHSTLLKGA